MRMAAVGLGLGLAARMAWGQGISAPPLPASPSPLAVIVSLHVRDVSLRDALDRLAVLARVRISYSGDVVPLDRRVSLARDSTTVGAVLMELLRGIPASPMELGADHIVLAPRAPADTGRSPPEATPVLERVVVTGSVIGAPERALAVALDVVSGRSAERRDEANLSSVLSASVPGVWLWEQAPATMSARYGSIRGASSFSVSYPKVYVDGIEVANPLLLTHIEPAQVERVEVIRGPQGAALYGADAISGVVNIVSRHENASDGRHAVAQTRMGWAGSAYADATPVQEHALSWRDGTNLRSAGVSGSFSSTGRYIPNAYSRQGRIAADARFVGASHTLSLTARAMGKRSGVPINPLLPALEDERTRSDGDPQSLTMYALGGTLRRMSTERLTIGFTAGLDGYRLNNISIENTPVPSSADSALRAATGGADRATVRASMVRTAGDAERFGVAFTLAAEQGVLRDRTTPPRTESSGPGPASAPFTPSRWSSNLGLAQQVNLSFARTAYLTAANRFEWISSSGAPPNGEALPMLGLSLVGDAGPVTGKVRGSFGRGIRATTHLMPLGDSRRLRSNYGLEPEEQTGIDGGVDLYFGGAASLHATRFDQTASGLVQLVTLYDSSSSGPSRDRIHYQQQNVGEISNRGWEGRLTVRAGPFDLGAAASTVDSRVRRLAHAYQGDLRPGDRMLGVPSRTGSVSAALVRPRWSTAWTFSRATDWIDYDRLAIAERLGDHLDDDHQLTGYHLRQFWVRYPGANRLRGTLSLELPRDLGLTITGENLTGEQRGEPDTMTILPGRTITAALRARF